MIERELLDRRGSAYAVMDTEVLPSAGTRVWLLCRACGFCFPANRIAIDDWHGDDCPDCGGENRTARPLQAHTRDLIQP